MHATTHLSTSTPETQLDYLVRRSSPRHSFLICAQGSLSKEKLSRHEFVHQSSRMWEIEPASTSSSHIPSSQVLPRSPRRSASQIVPGDGSVLWWKYARIDFAVQRERVERDVCRFHTSNHSLVVRGEMLHEPNSRSSRSSWFLSQLLCSNSVSQRSYLD